MAKAVEFEIKIKGDAGVLRTLTVEAANVDEAIGGIVQSASRAHDGIRRMAEGSIVLDTATRAVQNLQGMVAGLAGPFNSFETAMKKANTMAHKSGEEYDRLTSRVVGLSKEIPLLREELADGLYQTISNGVPEDNWISFLEQTARTAVGGVANLGQAVNVTSTVIKTYGKEWSEAGAIQDKIQTAAELGVTSFEAMSQALPKVSGSAAQLGVELDELLAVYASTTSVTGNTAEVSTQLAAVLNSLIKPTSEASRVADEMGIRFDAASIKACGGFRNFLTQLDASVKEYAASSGMLSETIYGQLFGSAEALRLLGSLTGEQKDKFAQNIEAMADSAGAIDRAFAEMSSSGDSVAAMVKNQILAWTDWAGKVAGMSAPYVQLTANMGTSILSIVQLVSLTKSVVAGLRAWDVATKAAAVTQGVVTATTKAWSVAQAALNVILSLNPIGLIVIAVGALVAALVTAYNNSEDFRKVCDRVWATVKKLASVVWDSLVKAFEMASNVIREAWKWVKEFFGIEDADDALEASEIIDRQAKSMASLAENNKAVAATGLKVAEATEWQRMSYEQLGKAIEKQKSLVAKLAGTGDTRTKGEADTLRRMEARYASLGKQYSLSGDSSSGSEFDGKRLIANAASYKELANNIAYYQDKLDRLAPSETAEASRLSAIITRLLKKQEALKLVREGYTVSENPETLGDIEQAISHQRKLRENASAANIGAIDSEINRLEDLKTALEAAGHSDIDPAQITTFRQLRNEISFYEGRLQDVTESERASVNARLIELRKIEKAWNDSIEAMNTPGDISTLDTVEKLSAAVGYYDSRMKNASVAELAGLAKQKDALERKLALLNRIASAPALKAEADRLASMDGKTLRLELEVIGLSSIHDKIRELQRMLADTEMPLAGEARADAEKSLEKWRAYELQLRKSQLGFTKTWESLKGMETGVRSLTEGLKGNGTAWERITALVDGFIQLYDKMRTVINIIKLLTTTTDAHRASKISETAATTADTTATIANTSAALTNTAAKSGEAVAEAVSSGAKLPFPANVAAIAAGVAAVISALAIVGSFSNGGIVGGNSPSGDRLLARVNSGEMILNKAQQQRLYEALNGGGLSLRPFANGGIAYGPAIGLFGEYAGAANNPEVVAPLSDLQRLIEPVGGGGTYKFELRARGKDLVAVGERVRRERERS
ncbi:MAG: phage tail tape measure protein [Duncaniella sp.]|nr:phage tail tape measure protein [Duncaniella sp.]